LRHTVPLRSFAIAAVLTSTIVFPKWAFAGNLMVGPGQQYATPCAAVAAASPNDVILIAPGTSAYTDTCRLDVAGITLKGVSGQPKVDVSGTVPLATFANGSQNLKGIYDVTADDVTIENMELTGANVGDSAAGNGANGAGIRDEASGLVVLGCYIHDNQDGILATAPNPGSTLTVEYTQLDHNALGDGCGGPGCTHNIYVGSSNMETFVFAFNWSHNAGDGNAAGNGHLLKTRAQTSYILYNALLGEMGTESYELDIPQGGLGVVVGNILQKSPMAGNPTLLTYAEEGSLNTSTDLYVASNTFVSDDTSGSVTFIKTASGTLAAHDNLFGSMGTPSSTGALSADNLQPSNPMFVNAAMNDFHLQAGAPAIGQGVAPGSAGGFSLLPVFEYVQPDESVARLLGAKLDVGAFQYGTNVTGAGQGENISVSDAGSPVLPDAGVSSRDAGGTATKDAGHSVMADGGHTTTSDAGRHVVSDGGAVKTDAGSASGGSGGCSCRASRSEDLGGGVWLGLGLVGWGVARSRRASSGRRVRRAG